MSSQLFNDKEKPKKTGKKKKKFLHFFVSSVIDPAGFWPLGEEAPWYSPCGYAQGISSEICLCTMRSVADLMKVGAHGDLG